MNLQKTLKQGFTLIELLVVVAIIGILSSVVLSYLGSARDKGADTAVKANLDTIRAQSEIFASNNNDSFLPTVGGATFALATCPTPYNASGSNMLVRDKTIFEAIREATTRGGNGNRCYNSSSSWAIAVGLKTNANTSWCIDHGGNAKVVAAAPAGAINGTTFLCN